MLSTRSTRLVALVVGILVLAGVGVGVAAAKSTDTKKFTVWEDDKSGPSTWFDLGVPRKGDPGSDIGDLLVEHKTLLDPSTGAKVGEAMTRGEAADVVAGDTVIIIDCTIKLAGGDVVFYGAGLFSKMMDKGLGFAVTGGTGKYRGAKGGVTVRVAERNGKPGANIAFNLK
jgi:hypothetical protein